LIFVELHIMALIFNMYIIQFIPVNEHLILFHVVNDTEDTEFPSEMSSTSRISAQVTIECTYGQLFIYK